MRYEMRIDGGREVLLYWLVKFLSEDRTLERRTGGHSLFLVLCYLLLRVLVLSLVGTVAHRSLATKLT
jgi:hypothetical protein